MDDIFNKDTEPMTEQELDTEQGMEASADRVVQEERISAETASEENTWQPGTGAAYMEQENVGKKKKKKKEKKPVTTGRLVRTCFGFMVVTVALNTAVTYSALRLNIGNYVTEGSYKKSTSILSTQSNINEKLQSGSTVVNTGNETSSDTLSVSDVAEAVLPSVVSITSTTIYQSNANPFLYGGSYQVSGAGSGIIIGANDTELLIVTNNHVVEDTSSLTIEFVDGTSVDAAYVKGTSSSNDIAVVAVKLSDISEETSKEIRIATLGDSDCLVVGDQVVAIGNALGYGQSVTVGYVSALNRSTTVEDKEINAIQTDASINGGNSGGALINMKGEVIGINFAKLSSSSSSSATVEGMGYAIPISQAKDIINELMNKEPKVEVDKDKKGYIGITSALSIDESVSQTYNLPKGAYLRGIAEGSPAEEAGVQIGDVVVAVNDEEITSYDELQEEMTYHAAGETITLTVKRAKGSQYEEKELKVTLCTYDELQEMINKK